MSSIEIELCYLPATEVLERFRSRSLSPVEYLETLIARAEQTEPSINAFAFTWFDQAMDQARAAEARYAAGSDDISVKAFLSELTLEINAGEQGALVPDLEAGNMLAKQLQYLAGALSAGIVLGARVPIALTSRADSKISRMASCAIAMLLAHHMRGRDIPWPKVS